MGLSAYLFDVFWRQDKGLPDRSIIDRRGVFRQLGLYPLQFYPELRRRGQVPLYQAEVH